MGDFVRIQPGVRLLVEDGQATHVEIDLNRSHIYDGNGMTLDPGLIRRTYGKPQLLLIEVGAFRKLADRIV